MRARQLDARCPPPRMGIGFAGRALESQVGRAFAGNLPTPSSLRRQGPRDFAWPVFMFTRVRVALLPGGKPLDACLRRHDGWEGAGRVPLAPAGRASESHLGYWFAGRSLERQAGCGFAGNLPTPSSLRRQGPRDFALPVLTCTRDRMALPPEDASRWMPACAGMTGGRALGEASRGPGCASRAVAGY